MSDTVYSRVHKCETLVGMGFFVCMMAVGYYYNVTFIQLGLLDLGTKGLGLAAKHVTALMAGFALITCAASIAMAAVMTRFRRTSTMLMKLRISAVVAVAQTALTLVSASITSLAGFTVWLVVAAVLIGSAIPSTFGLTVDLVPVRYRGATAAAITAMVYLAAPVLSCPWTFDHLRAQLLPALTGGAIVAIVLAYVPNRSVAVWATQCADSQFGVGRYTAERNGRGGASHLVLIAILMFGAFFVDSLGFLRLSEEPLYMQGAWHAQDVETRLFIGIVHLIGAWIAGVFYAAFDFRSLFAWSFGLFALTHLLYTFPLRLGEVAPVLAESMIYALAVSIYTTLNFALWSDLSTSRTMARNAAIGVGFSGWTATFISTGLALKWRSDHMDVATHLRIVDAIAVVLFLGMLGSLYVQLASGGRGVMGGRRA